MKKVLLFVVDALASRIVVPAMESGQLPMMSQLVGQGTLLAECTSVFPSITPAATASIATGVYPTDHCVAGAFWYDQDDNSVAYYGDDFWVIINEGVNNFFNEFLVGLNEHRLCSDTLYERIERHGLTAAAINFMWFKGETKHQVNAPLLLKLLPTFLFAPSVHGPKVLGLADFVSSDIPGRDEPLSASGGASRRFGFHDDTTAEYLLSLAAADPFPDFMAAYFPNNDFVSHAEGPAAALKVLEAFDDHLSQFIGQMGGIDTVLDQFAVFIVGDHSQCDMVSHSNDQAVRLDEILEDYQLSTPGVPWDEADDMTVCPNMRATNIYVHKRDESLRNSVIQRLLSDPRVDQVFWREHSWNQQGTDLTVDRSDDRFHVFTSDRGNLTFTLATSDDVATGIDGHGNKWKVEGDWASIDATVENGRIKFREYPNALERIAAGFAPSSGDLWVTAHDGYEFCLNETSIHDGGSHGSLNKGDSTTSLIIAGLPDEITIPEHPRTIDVAPMVLRCLGLGDEADSLIHHRFAGATC